MQQAATLAHQAPSSAADGNVVPGALRNAFVINLTSSTTPVALTRPEHAGLRRFTFFVSRRREEGRERFRLHMGYFDTQEEAEKLLDIVREIYPGAWAGLTPGRGLRGTPPVAQPQDIAPAASSDSPALERAAQPPSSGRSAVVTSISVVAAAPPASTPAARGAVTSTAAGQPTNARPRSRPVSDQQTAARALDGARSSIDALEDSAGAAAAAAMLPKSPRIVPTLRAAGAMPVVQPVALARPAAAVVTAAKGTPQSGLPTRAVPPVVHAPSAPQAAPQSPRSMSEQAVLGLLEGSARAANKASAAARGDEKPCYAVQLAWSAEPIQLTRVPQLAIFNAYTLYGAQGHRDGRRWYGLRLGFFTDAVSAKQVAQYVRSDFTTVAVVPVSSRERDQAKQAIAVAAAPRPATVVPVPGAARPVRSAQATAAKDEFKFIDDAAAEAVPRVESRPRGSLRPSRGAPGKRAVFRAGRIHAKSKAKQMTLEETLEILGANDLEVPVPKKPAVSEGDVPTPVVLPAQGKPSKLSRLFERLSERLGT